MSYLQVIDELPRDLQVPMLKLAEALRRDFAVEFAVQREDFNQLRAVVQELAEAQKRTEQRVEELAEAQKRTEQRVEELAEAQRQSEVRLARLETAMAELAEAQKRTEEAIQKLTAEQREMKISLAVLQGERLERQFRDKAPAYFGRILRRTRALSLQELEAELEDRLDRDELQEVLLLDAVVRGCLSDRAEDASILLAVETSLVVDRNDVERAARRAAFLRKAGYVAVPTAAGEKITPGAIEAARQAGVLLVQDGQRLYWDEALAAALSSQE